jgi:tripartite-type tricarboxylate transporter receptor subunit TctC
MPGGCSARTEHAVMETMNLRPKIFGLLAVLAILSPAPAGAQEYPSRPITLVVPVPPGGAADFIGRTIGAKLADALGQPVVIANRGGAGGTIATAGVAKAEADGYTLLLASITTHGIGPHLYSGLPYDPAKDFAPVFSSRTFR